MARREKKPAGEQRPGETAPRSTGGNTADSPDRDRIAARAYELYQQRGGRDGADLEDWLAAERELGGVDAAAFGTTPGATSATGPKDPDDSERSND